MQSPNHLSKGETCQKEKYTSLINNTENALVTTLNQTQLEESDKTTKVNIKLQKKIGKET